MAGPPQLKPSPVVALTAGLAAAAMLAVWMPTPPAGQHRAASAKPRPPQAQRLTPTVPPMQPGEDYRLVRRRLLAQGWRPLQQPAEPGCSLLPDDRRCALYPELASCAMTGLGLCRFDWISPGGVAYAVITRDSAADGRPGRIERWFISR